MRFFTLIASLLLVACTKTPSAAPDAGAAPTTVTPTTVTPTTAAAASDAGAAAPDERVTAADQGCTQDSDCTLTTADCCGCTSLGKQIGVRADKVAELAARRAPICAAVSCAQAMSDDPSCNATKAVCRDGVCVPDVPGAAPAPTPVAPIP